MPKRTSAGLVSCCVDWLDVGPRVEPACAAALVEQKHAARVTAARNDSAVRETGMLLLMPGEGGTTRLPIAEDDGLHRVHT